MDRPGGFGALIGIGYTESMKPFEDRPQRYTAFAFPRTRYVPGQGVHPTQDPQRVEIFFEPVAEGLTSRSLLQRPQFLYGADLFNYGYWWEAHEAFEALWLEAGQQSSLGKALQGLIYLCGAMVKIQTGQLSVAERFVEKAQQLLTHHPAAIATPWPQTLEQVRLYVRQRSGPWPVLSVQALLSRADGRSCR